MENDPVLRNSHKYYDMSREEQMINSMAKARKGFKKMGPEFFFKTQPGANEMTWAVAYMGLPTLYLHWTMFY